jgi:hypothetical protein
VLASTGSWVKSAWPIASKIARASSGRPISACTSPSGGPDARQLGRRGHHPGHRLLGLAEAPLLVAELEELDREVQQRIRLTGVPALLQGGRDQAVGLGLVAREQGARHPLEGRHPLEAGLPQFGRHPGLDGQAAVRLREIPRLDRHPVPQPPGTVGGHRVGQALGHLQQLGRVGQPGRQGVRPTDGEGTGDQDV